jgi:hypothetical protein
VDLFYNAAAVDPAVLLLFLFPLPDQQDEVLGLHVVGMLGEAFLT